MATVTGETLSQDTIIARFEENWRENRRSWGKIPSVEIRDDDTFFWFRTGLKPNWFNAVMKMQLPEEDADLGITTVVDHFAQRDQPFMWVVGPSSLPLDLDRRLIAHGFKNSGHIPTMSLLFPKTEIVVEMPSELKISRVNSGRKFIAWKHVIYNNFEGDPPKRDTTYKYQVASAYHPGKQHFVGFWEGKPVAVSTLLLAHGVAGVYSVITSASARRRGVGKAMTQYALLTAQNAGYQVATLQSSRLGLNIFKSLGFQNIFESPVYSLG